MYKSILFAIIIFTLPLNLLSQSNWFWLDPLPTGATLNSVDFIDRNTGYTCGKAGVITKTTNGGINWTLLGQITVNQLYDIECLNANTCIAVGENGLIFKTTNGGINWDNIPSGTTTVFNEINFPNLNTGYICGFGGVVYKTTNQGNSWAQIQSGLSTTLYSISFYDVNYGAAGGFNTVFTTTNGGVNWTSHPLGSFFDVFQTVNYVSANEIYALLSTENTVFKTTNSGMSWTPYIIGVFDPSDLERSMVFKDSQTGFITTQFGDIGKSTNGGVNWFLDTTFAPEYNDVNVFWDINIVDTSIIYSVGSGGMIVHSTNAGAVWEKQIGNIKTYRDVFFTNANTGFITGEKGLLIKTVDAGLSWNRINLNTTFGIKKVFFTNPSIGYICGDSGLVRKTTTAGVNWISQTIPAAETN